MTSVAECTASPSASAASRASALSVVITRMDSATSDGGAASRFNAVEITPSPIGLVSTRASPACAPRFGEHPGRIDRADDREPELRFGVVDGVAAAHDRTRGPDDVVATVEHAREELERQALAGPRDEVQGEEWRAAHRVDVGQGVRGRDPAPVVRVVDDRREEVGGEHHGEVVAEAVDRGVVGRVEPDEEVGVGGRVTQTVDESEHGAQVGGRELARASRAVRELREPDRSGVCAGGGHRVTLSARPNVESGWKTGGRCPNQGRAAPMMPGQIGVIWTKSPVLGACSTLEFPT